MAGNQRRQLIAKQRRKGKTAGTKRTDDKQPVIKLSPYRVPVWGAGPPRRSAVNLCDVSIGKRAGAKTRAKDAGYAYDPRW